ncbi:hypothetical protein AYI70_g9291 [Smittium culicis]|uniref:Uncharacterized protein n=1 Tax=Smittium culicis TaxID=133412 RepID=A0A1R1XBZ0_9FUNG|nr:hypothetical protein AYI70_g9291 [Smittium culicis]
MDLEQLEKRVLLIDSQLSARKEALKVNQVHIESQIDAIKEENAIQGQFRGAMADMQMQGQTVVAELEHSKEKNKVLAKEKRLQEREIELANNQNILAAGQLKLEKQKVHILNGLLERQDASKNNNIPRSEIKISNATRTGKEIPLQSFEGNPLEFQRWISNVDDYFKQYYHISDFERKYIVVSALKEKAK